MPVVLWNPAPVLGAVAKAFPPSVAKAAGLARSRAPIRTGELRRSINPMVTSGLVGALIARTRHAAAQEYGVSASYIIGAGGQVLFSRTPRSKPDVGGGAPRILGKRSTRQNFGPVRGPVRGPTFPGRGFMRFGAMGWKALYINELRKRMPH